MKYLSRLADMFRPFRIIRRVGRTPLTTVSEEVWIATSAGQRIYAHLHKPAVDAVFPGIVFVPGAASCGMDYDRIGAEIQPKTLAALGFAVIHYDPSGRGRTGGKEDFWGAVHQDELVDVLKWTQKRPEVIDYGLSVISFSIGIAIASGALARHSGELPFVRLLYDWEGPSNRFIITKNDTHPPLKRFPTSDVEFWQKREPYRFISRIKCGYFRYQARIDHMQGNNKDHAVEMVNLATQGHAAWTQLNNNALNQIYSPPVPEECWVNSEKTDRLAILQAFLRVSGKDNV